MPSETDWRPAPDNFNEWSVMPQVRNVPRADRNAINDGTLLSDRDLYAQLLRVAYIRFLSASQIKKTNHDKRLVKAGTNVQVWKDLVAATPVKKVPASLPADSESSAQVTFM